MAVAKGVPALLRDPVAATGDYELNVFEADFVF